MNDMYMRINCKILSYLVQCAGFVGFAIEIAI